LYDTLDWPVDDINNFLNVCPSFSFKSVKSPYFEVLIKAVQSRHVALLPSVLQRSLLSTGVFLQDKVAVFGFRPDWVVSFGGDSTIVGDSGMIGLIGPQTSHLRSKTEPLELEIAFERQLSHQTFELRGGITLRSWRVLNHEHGAKAA
jgi:hypothetical protein